MKQRLLNFSFLFLLGVGVSIAQNNVALASNGASVTSVTDSNSTVYSGSDTGSGWTNGQSKNYPGSNAIDGNSVDNDNRWIWKFDQSGVNPNAPLPVEMIINFGATYTINAFKFIEGTDASADFTIDAWDGSAWQNVVSVTGNPAAPTETTGSFADITTDQIRITWTAHNNSSFIRMYEVEIYEAVGGFEGDEEIISSTDGILDNGANTISDLSPGELASELLAGLALNPGVTAEVFQSDGTTLVAGTDFITTGMIVRTTSPFDADIRDYVLSSTTLSNVVSSIVPVETLIGSASQHTASANDPAVLTDGVIIPDGVDPKERQLVKIEAPEDQVSYEFDLGADYDIAKLALYTVGSETATSFSNSIIEFKLEYSIDGGSYQEILSETTNADASYYSDLNQIVTADKLLLTIIAGDDRFSRLTEIQVFGAAAGTLDVEDNQLSNFSVYPNPANGNYVTIKSVKPITSIKVYNVVGKRVVAPLKDNKVDVSKLQSGMYFLSINNGVQTTKIIKK